MDAIYYQPAHALLQQLDTGKITSEQLVQALLVRIQEHNSLVNAVIALDKEGALEKAREADRLRNSGQSNGPLHGLPLTVKDTWEVAGMTCTAGAPALKDHRPQRHADVIRRLEDAGAIILGKTNVPLYASDVQSYNKLFGVTQNPYDPARTPGGSSGGAAAALASGFTPLEVGSDLAGSIRTPAHFCGVFGHKPSRGLVSFRGHIPGPPGTQSQPDLAEGGPLARNSKDLELLLKVIAGPRPQDSDNWNLKMTAPEFQRLDQVRVGTWFRDPLCPVEEEITTGHENLSKALESQGALVTKAQHPLLSLEHILPAYFNLLGSLIGTSLKPGMRRQMKWIARLERYLHLFGPVTPGIGEYARGVNQPIYEWTQWSEKREKMRAQIASLFDEIDVLLTPVTPTVAIPHDHSEPVFKRRIEVAGKQKAYMDQFCWIAMATLLGLPATSVPIGRNKEGLPYNIQVIGAPGKDLTTIRFGQLLEEAGLAGFKPPTNF